MKKKIVIHVPMHGDKAKSKAIKIVVAIQGVVSVSIGEENDRLVVIGEGVDSVRLANSLRKKFSFADIVTLEDVKPPTPSESSPSSSPNSSSPSSSPNLSTSSSPKSSTSSSPMKPNPLPYYLPPSYCPQLYYYDAAPPNICSVM